MQRVRRPSTLCLLKKSESAPWPFRAVADDRRRLAVARPVAELLERGVDAVVLRGVHAVHLPVEGREHRLELAASGTPCGWRYRAGRCCGPPSRTGCRAASGRRTSPLPRSALPAARRRRSCSRSRSGATMRPAIANPCATAEALAHRSGGDVDARQDRTGMAVQDARVRARVAQDCAVEVAELGVDRRQRRHRVALAEHEQILPARASGRRRR